ncbi:MarR family winged helix-turn-helix transcriptional regulator [Streptomyces sp. NBC_01465]|uniref:MarR family winged helix-turn-helix transcriptional regulator n=1 Tax=Streptomyces sp. NBC_01465 TaxID=2903878 RepID=UPI002E347805|nr:MarR family transcriptional regulator [Streptomyces sp. NBC_01465]
MDSESPAPTIRRGAIRLARRLRAERPADALSVGKVGVLGHLHRHGPSTPGDIAAAEHQQPQSLTRIFAELERDGLIVRSPSERDRRRVLLELTRDGLVVLVGDMAARDAWLEGAIAGLSETEREVLRLAGALMERIAESAG